MKDVYDFLVIGGGSAGYAAARTALEFTSSVAVVEGAEELGGLCILRGCMPSKTLIYASEVLHRAKEGHVLGLNIPLATAEMARVQARKKAVVNEFADYRKQGLESGKFDLIRSHAVLTSKNEILLSDGRRVTAKKTLIATGSKVNIPDVPGLKESKAWTSDDVLNLDFIPESVVVFGGGIVGCELAQFLARIGTQVTIIQRSKQLLKDMSPEAGECLRQAFESEGIHVMTDTLVSKIGGISGEGVTIQFNHKGCESTVKAKYLFNALGREPNTSGLNLQVAGVDLKDSGHVVANGFMQSSNPDIYAAGDCVGPYEIVHIAVQQGETAAKHALGQTVPEIDYALLMSVIFTDPQIAVVGKTAAQLSRGGTPFISARYPFDDHGKSILMEAKRGYVAIFSDDTGGRILGAEIMGRDAGELIHIFSVAIQMKATVFDLLRAPWYHPTLAEIVTYPLEEIVERLRK